MAKKKTDARVVVTARVEPQLAAALQRQAVKEDRTVSYLVERAIREYVEQLGKHK